jgi:hypothetical protein
MVTFTINIPPMLAYIPYMDPMGYEMSTSVFNKEPGSVTVPRDVLWYIKVQYMRAMFVQWSGRRAGLP